MLGTLFGDEPKRIIGWRRFATLHFYFWICWSSRHHSRNSIFV